MTKKLMLAGTVFLAAVVLLCAALFVAPAPAQAATDITTVTVTGLTMPTPGAKLDFTVQLGDVTYEVDYITWDDCTAEQNALGSDVTAVEGHKYRYDVMLKPVDGYQFPQVSGTGWQPYTGSGTLNGAPFTNDPETGAYAMVLDSAQAGNNGFLDLWGYYTCVARNTYNIKTTFDAGVESVTLDSYVVSATNFTAGWKEGAGLPGQVKLKSGYAVDQVLFNNAALAVAADNSFTFDLSKNSALTITTRKLTDQQKTILINATVGQQIASGAVAYGLSGWTSASAASDATKYPNTLSEYGLSGSFSVNGFTPTGTPTKAGEATFTVQLSYPGYSYFVTYKINIAAAAAAPTITAQPKAVTVQAGETATFTVKASGDDLHYQWYADGAKAGTDSASLSIKKTTVKEHDGVRVYCVVTNAAGTATSDKAKLTVTAASAYVFPFTDVASSDWFYADVKNANQLRLIDGKTAKLYKPNDNMTYAEAIKLAACMHQLYHDGSVTLKNGSPNWYDSYVEYARQNGIPYQYSNYNANITRAEYVYIFYYALPVSEYGEKNSIADNAIPDVKLSANHSQQIYKFYRAGILTGSSGGQFKPADNIKRSEVAAILSRMMDEDARRNVSL